MPLCADWHVRAASTGFDASGGRKVGGQRRPTGEHLAGAGETSAEPTERAAAAEGDPAALYRTGWGVGPHATGQRADGKGRAAAQGWRVSRDQSWSGVSCGARVKPLGPGTVGVWGYGSRRPPALFGTPHGQRLR